MWSGRSEPGDPGATGLLQAVRNSTAARTSAAVRAGGAVGVGGTYESVPEGGYEGHDTGATQVIPRIALDDDATTLTPVVGGGRGGGAGGRPGGGRSGPLLPPMRQAVGAYDAPSEGNFSDREFSDREFSDRELSERELYDALDPDDDRPRAQRHGADTVRHAYYPGRRMNLGVVLLPLRVFLGFISIYAGMGKLCDPVYFDGGERGSMVKWLHSLHPWALAEPLRDFALSHPVGAGLSIAFLQIVVGVLTVLGLWQRVAASFGAVLSAALLLTVSWRTVPAYDAPDIIYLAAWSPLIIAGAPVYSVDGRLAGEAWRRLGPRSEIWDLRRRVLRRGAVLASVVIGLTFLIGSVLGGAVRSSDMVTVPGPNDDPVNQLPGVPLPRESSGRASASGTPSGGSRASGKPHGAVRDPLQRPGGAGVRTGAYARAGDGERGQRAEQRAAAAQPDPGHRRRAAAHVRAGPSAPAHQPGPVVERQHGRRQQRWYGGHGRRLVHDGRLVVGRYGGAEPDRGAAGLRPRRGDAQERRTAGETYKRRSGPGQRGCRAAEFRTGPSLGVVRPVVVARGCGPRGAVGRLRAVREGLLGTGAGLALTGALSPRTAAATGPRTQSRSRVGAKTGPGGQLLRRLGEVLRGVDRPPVRAVGQRIVYQYALAGEARERRTFVVAAVGQRGDEAGENTYTPALIRYGDGGDSMKSRTCPNSSVSTAPRESGAWPGRGWRWRPAPRGTRPCHAARNVSRCRHWWRTRAARARAAARRRT